MIKALLSILFLPAALLVASVLVAPAFAAGGGGSGPAKPPKPLSVTEESALGLVHIDPLPLPGKDKLSYVRLEAQLKIRPGKNQLADVNKVLDLKPRIVGRIIDAFQTDRITSLSLSAADMQDIKDRIKEAANAACGQPLVVDVLIMSLLVT